MGRGRVIDAIVKVHIDGKVISRGRLTEASLGLRREAIFITTPG
jgi:hypothetical protein